MKNSNMRVNTYMTVSLRPIEVITEEIFKKEKTVAAKKCLRQYN